MQFIQKMVFMYNILFLGVQIIYTQWILFHFCKEGVLKHKTYLSYCRWRQLETHISTPINNNNNNTHINNNNNNNTHINNNNNTYINNNNNTHINNNTITHIDNNTQHRW